MAKSIPTTEPEATWQHADYLHAPKAPRLELYEHLDEASSLSRALWLMLNSDDLDLGDRRNQQAAIALASEVARHASAAMVTWYEKSEAAREAKTAGGPADA